MMLICNEGKEDKKYHIAYQLNTGSPIIPYCRMTGHLDVLVQVQSNNPKVCVKCKNAAGVADESTVAAEAVAPDPKDHPAVKALEDLRTEAHEATTDSAWWWQDKIDKACKAAGIDDLPTG